MSTQQQQTPWSCQIGSIDRDGYIRHMQREIKNSTKSVEEDSDDEEEDEEREYTIEKQVAGMGYMSFYDEKDMLDQIVYCKNGCWKLKGDKTARDLDGDLCVTDDEEEEEESNQLDMKVLGFLTTERLDGDWNSLLFEIRNHEFEDEE